MTNLKWLKSRSFKIGIGIISIILLTLMSLEFYDWLQVDKCLDQGGRWNYETEMCEYKR